MSGNRAARVMDRAPVRQKVNLREYGFELVARVNRWLLAAALAVTGAVALLADHAFHSAQRTSRAVAAKRVSASGASAAAASSAAGASTIGGGSAGGGNAGAASAPAPAAPSATAVVSGGS
jgi:hypothetical protein